jgi:hypothetical protein
MRFKPPSLDQTEKGLEQTEKGLEWVSGKLTLAAWVAGITVAVFAFIIVQIFAIFPYIELKHTAIAGALIAAGAGGWIYMLVSRPADLVGKAGWGVWIAKLAVKMSKKHLVKNEAATATGAPGATAGGDSSAPADTSKK